MAVEKDVDKVLTKFNGINEHSKRVLSELIDQINNLKEELQNGKFLCLKMIYFKTFLRKFCEKRIIRFSCTSRPKWIYKLWKIINLNDHFGMYLLRRSMAIVRFL